MEVFQGIFSKIILKEDKLIITEMNSIFLWQDVSRIGLSRLRLDYPNTPARSLPKDADSASRNLAFLIVRLAEQARHTSQ
jgi:hypothetical protein